MGTPYAPLGQDSYAIAYGPTSLSKLFVFASLSFVFGVWLGSYPTCARFAKDHAWVWPAVSLLGGLTTVLIVVPSWMNALFSMLFVPDGFLDWHSYAIAYPVVYAAGDALAPLLGHGVLLCSFGSFLCGWSGWLLVDAGNSRWSRGRVETLSRHMKASGLWLPYTVVYYLLGIVQPLAWVLLLPHSTFPQPVAATDGIIPGYLWSADTLGLASLLIVMPTLLMMLLAIMTMGRANHGGSTGAGAFWYLAPAVSLSLGILSFRLIARSYPELNRISFKCAIIGLVLYIALICLCLLVTMRVTSRPEGLGALTHTVDRDCRGQANVQTSPAVLLKDMVAFLEERGLSRQEMLSVSALASGADASTAGDAMGVSKATVREYWRRARGKLGVGTNQELAEFVRTRIVGHARPEVEVQKGFFATSKEILRLALLASLLLLGSLLLLPFGGAGQTWNDALMTGFGLGIGMALAWVCSLMTSGNGRTTRLAVLGGIGVLALSAGLLFVMRLAEGLGGTARSVLVLCLTALFASQCLALIGFFLDWPISENGFYGKTGICIAGAVTSLGVIIGSHGSFAWEASCAISLAGVITSAAFVMWLEPQAFLANVRREPVPPGLCWLAAVALMAWAWGETWRSVSFDSPLRYLQWGAVVFILLWLAWAVLSDRVSIGHACATTICSVAVALACGVGHAIVVCCLSTWVLLSFDTNASKGRPSQGMYAWHSPLLVGAAGVVAGMWLTNYVGDYFEWTASFQVVGGPLGLRALAVAGLAALLVLLFVGCLVACVHDGSRRSYSPSRRNRVHAYLMGAGLSGQQADIVIHLMSGSSVLEVCARTGVSRSVVGEVRRDAYRALGVNDREGLRKKIDAFLEVDGV